MTKFILILPALFFFVVPGRADLVLEQQLSDARHTEVATLKIHGDKMRLDQPDRSLSVIVDLKTRDSDTLITTNKTFLQRFGTEAKWEAQEELKVTGGTNDMDAPPAPAADTGKSGVVNGWGAEIYTWTGARGRSETLWVATNFPNYNAIRRELLKLDLFNETGLHRNAQPALNLLPGMVMKSEITLKGVTVTNTLVSVKVEPVDATNFTLPADYTLWKPAKKKP